MTGIMTVSSAFQNPGLNISGKLSAPAQGSQDRSKMLKLRLSVGAMTRSEDENGSQQGKPTRVRTRHCEPAYYYSSDTYPR